jgi:uncharacterized repeat protein (TIGR01451 family)
LISISNSGDAPLSNVDVVDATTPACDRSDLTLAVGQTRTWSCAFSPVSVDFTNTVRVTADDPNGDPVAVSSASADVTVLTPGVTISKTPDLQLARSGDDVTFTITVANSGETVLTDVTVVDALVPACGRTFASIAVGATETYSCTLADVTGDLTNTATVDALDPLGNPLPQSRDSAVVDVVGPSIAISKTPDVQSVALGDQVTFAITITNTGETVLTGIVVTDVATPACATTLASLPTGATHSYSCTTTSAPTASFVNTAAVVALPSVGPAVTSTDSASVTVLQPGVTVDKTPAVQSAGLGTDVTFTIRVTNSGQVDLVTVDVVDAVTPSCSRSLTAPIAVGRFVEFTCVATGVAADFTNTVVVTATDANDNTVTATDSALVDVLLPGISVEKSPGTQVVAVNGTATFTIVVTNTGEADLADVDVIDAVSPSCSRLDLVLAPGASQTWTCTVTPVTADFVNTVTVTAVDPAGNVVTTADSATVDMEPVGTITGRVFHDVDGDGVSGAGDVPLANVSVTITGADGIARPGVTDATGFYTLANLPVGSYSIDVDDADADIPAGAVVSTGNDPQVLTVGNGVVTAAGDVGFALPGSVSGVVFVDRNGDGLQDPTGLAGVTVQLLDATGTVVATTISGSDGSYTFHAVRRGTYIVAVVAPAGHRATVQDLGSDDRIDSDIDATGRTAPIAVVAGGSTADVDAGLYLPAAIGDTVWLDLDRDGVEDPGEPGIPGVTLQVVSAGPDGLFGTVDDVSSTHVTDARGHYHATGLRPGATRVTVVAASYDVTTVGERDDVLASGDDKPTADFGLSGTAVLGQLVFNDLNHDGVHQPSEPGAAGVTVLVRWAGFDGVLGTSDDVTTRVVTGDTGRWLIPGLAAGTYVVAVDPATVPAGYTAPPETVVSLTAGQNLLTVAIPLDPKRLRIPSTGSQSALELRWALMISLAGVALLALSGRRRRITRR